MQDQPVLLFDIMDTLVHDPFNDETPAFFGMTREELLEQNNTDAWIRFELGEIEEAEYLKCYFNNRRSFDQQAFSRRLEDAYRWVEGAERLLERLAQRGFEIHAFSNYPIWYRTIEARLGLSRFLRWTFVSCLTGARKPAASAYQGVAQRLKRSLSSTLFIDNSSRNCRAAEALGMPSIQFVDTTSLWHTLQDLGVVQ